MSNKKGTDAAHYIAASAHYEYSTNHERKCQGGLE